jgi:hypothetical protein
LFVIRCRSASLFMLLCTGLVSYVMSACFFFFFFNYFLGMTILWSLAFGHGVGVWSAEGGPGGLDHGNAICPLRRRFVHYVTRIPNGFMHRCYVFLVQQHAKGYAKRGMWRGSISSLGLFSMYSVSLSCSTPIQRGPPWVKLCLFLSCLISRR